MSNEDEDGPIEDDADLDVDLDADPETADDAEALEALGDDLEEAFEAAGDGEGDAKRSKRAIFSVPIQVVVSVGRAHPTIGDLLNMRRDALLTLDTKIDDPVDIIVGKRVVARGELQEVEDEEGRLCVRLTEIVDLSQPL